MRKKIIFFIALLILLSLPLFVHDYFMHIVIYIFIYSILGLGFAVMWKMKLINLGQSAFWGIGAYTSAVLTKEMDVSFWLALPIAGLASAAVAFVIYAIALRTTRMMYFTMSIFASLIFPEVIGGTAALGSWGGYVNIPSPVIGSFVFDSKTEYYYLALFLLLLTLITFYALYESRIGRAWTAIGQSIPLSQALGINLFWYQLVPALIGPFFAGLAGSYIAAYLTVLEPATYGLYNSIQVQLQCLIGGLGNALAGPLLGAVVMLILPELLRTVEEFQIIVYGVLLILLVIYLPGGILSVPERYPRAGLLLRGLRQKLGRLKTPGEDETGKIIG